MQFKTTISAVKEKNEKL